MNIKHAAVFLALLQAVIFTEAFADDKNQLPVVKVIQPIAENVGKYSLIEVVVVSDENSESACGLEATSKELLSKFSEEVKKSGKFQIAKSDDTKNVLLAVLTIKTLGYQSPPLTPIWLKCHYYSDHNKQGTLALSMRVEDKETATSLGVVDIHYHAEYSVDDLGTTMRQVSAFSKELSSHLLR
jgi:hypothetical protein